MGRAKRNPSFPFVFNSRVRTNPEMPMTPITRSLLAALLVSTTALAGIHTE
jgi:hypothetical protein